MEMKKTVILTFKDYRVMVYHGYEGNKIYSEFISKTEPDDDFFNKILDEKVHFNLLQKWEREEVKSVTSISESDFFRSVNGMLFVVYERYREKGDRSGKNTFDKPVAKHYYFTHEDIIARLPAKHSAVVEFEKRKG